jgi:VWFA-related protein
MRPTAPFLLIALAALPHAAWAQLMRGKVVMPDGSAPARAIVERLCPETGPVQVAVGNKRGEFVWRVGAGIVDDLGMFHNNSPVICYLRARVPEYESNLLDLSDPKVFRTSQFPPLVLHRAKAREEVERLPAAAGRAWPAALKAMNAQNWVEAERRLRDVTRVAPQFALGWSSLGAACANQKKTEDARAAYRRAVALDPASLRTRMQLLRVEMAGRLWDDAVRTAEALIQDDSAHEYPEATRDHGIASFMLDRTDAARRSLLDAARLDREHRFPEIDYYLGGILAVQGDRAGATARLRSYLAQAPDAANAEFVRGQIAALAANGAAPPPISWTRTAPPTSLDPPPFRAGGEAWIPGGARALAAVAHLAGTPADADFFLEYCRAISLQSSRANQQHIYDYTPVLLAYLEAVAGLTEVGEAQGDRIAVHLSLADAESTRKTERVLGLLGWRLSADHQIEPGDQPADGPRQLVTAALGIDELGMRAALAAGRTFGFEIGSGHAPLYGGAGWNPLLAQVPYLPGGIAEAFVRQPRLARTYAGLAAMGGETGTGLARRVGLTMLAAEFADELWLYGDTFRAAGGRAEVPGGAAAEPVWAKLAGTSPADSSRFFEAVLKTDHGRLAAYYAAVARADAAHQRFFTHDAARAERFYTWYRDSAELRDGIGLPVRAWRASFFRDLPLTESGSVRFPGGREAWRNRAGSPDDDVLFLAERSGSARAGVQPALDFEALLEIARLEHDRGRPLDAASAALLAHNFESWRALFPYFAALPALGAAEFEELEKFAASVSSAAPEAQNAILGEWHSLIELTVLGRRAGSLDDAAAASAFGRICRDLSGTEHASRAIALLAGLTGSHSNLDDEVAAGLLRLSAPRRKAFDRIRTLQNAPRLSALGTTPAASKVPLALSGLVYGALLDPEALLVNEDNGLLSRHDYVPDGLFRPASLFTNATAPGSHFAGGFSNFEDVARNLARVPADGTPAAAADPPDAPTAASSGPATDTVFHASGRLVEVHTTVTDERGRYVDDLAAGGFQIVDGGKPVPLAAFENRGGPVSCALLLDTTASMEHSLASVKSAAVRLISALRPDDTVAVYSLTGGISELQPFTADKTAATRAVLRASVGSMTALYDALVRVNRDLATRTGKKVIVVFTDGEDNISTLTGDTAVVRAKTSGVPIYTIAQGGALHNRALLGQLAGMSQATGGLAFTLQSSAEIGAVFDRVLQDLLHGYLLAFQPAPAEERGWRKINVVLRAPRGRKVRAREGYFPE